MRLIDADALGNRLYHEVFEKDSEDQRWDSGCWMRYRLFEKVLREQPTIEQSERMRGTWIIKDNPGTEWYRVTCSECGENVTSEIPLIGFLPNAKAVWDYCPYCGADMREVDNERV